MQDRAIENLQTILKRRNLSTATESITTSDLSDVNLYVIGDILVVFSTKSKGIIDRDVTKFVNYAEKEHHNSGMIIVSLAEPSENVLRVIKTYSRQRLQYFWIHELQFDWTTHRYHIPHYIWNEDTRAKFPLYAEIYDGLNIKKPIEELPYIDSNEYNIKIIGAVPDDIILILRPSDTSGVVPYWRYCVEDVNVA
jgi:DNA-directed RNA polymerase subunit H (RpoH/RPB5)